MIIVRSPLRIPLGGGGTDLPSYFERHSGSLISGAIDRYVYITIHQTFDQRIFLRYSKMEHVHVVDEVQHPIIRESLKLFAIDRPHLEITSMADIPAGTGLGSSGSFTTALLMALHASRHETIKPHELAEEACRIEIEKLKEPIGKQDQFAAAYGGLNRFQFLANGQVVVTPLKISTECLYNLEDNLMLFFTGYSRSASTILREQDEKSRSLDPKMIENLHFIKEIGYQTQDALEQGDLRRFADLMNTHWEHKKYRSGGMSNPDIDKWYELAMNNGALGGKLIGAGGGGFLMFYAEEKTRLRHVLTEAGLREVRFRFDFEGTRVLIQ